jgi:lysophospholipase L1-like esterase
MMTVLCYGDSNTFGTPPVLARDELRRFAPDERWPGILRRELGSGWSVIEEGLPGRTTVHGDPIEGAHKNGLSYLLPCLESHRPIDLVALMLGTNDLKARFSLPAEDIAEGIGVLLDAIAKSFAGPAGTAPRVLLIAPPPLARLELLAGMFTGGSEKSRQLGSLYAAVAARFRSGFLDAGSIIGSSDIDGIHFAASEHAKLGTAVAVVIRGLGFEPPG